MRATDSLVFLLMIVVIGQGRCGWPPFKFLINGEIVTISAVPDGMKKREGK